MASLYLFSGEYTIMSHASIFTNLSGILIVFYRGVRGNRVHLFEIIGTVIALTGCFITIFDHNAEKVNTEH